MTAALRRCQANTFVVRPALDRRRVTVTIEQTAPTERVSLFTRAFGLSSRETELLGHLVSGSGTRDVAARMFLSEYTVQDHLKSIIAKTTTRSRLTLLARVLGVPPGGGLGDVVGSQGR